MSYNYTTKSFIPPIIAITFAVIGLLYCIGELKPEPKKDPVLIDSVVIQCDHCGMKTKTYLYYFNDTISDKHKLSDSKP